jgi:hypothetical protein
LYTDLDSKTMNSGWNQKRKAIQTRKKGWIGRLKSDIDTGKVDAIQSARKTEDGSCHPRQQFIDLKKPVRPKVEYVSNLGVDADHLSLSVLCMVCFSYVSIGNERVVCQHCPVVIHCSCIKNPLDYTSLEYKAQNSESENAIPTSYDITWTCAFCIHDIKKKNHDSLDRYRRAMVRHVFKTAVVKVQSFFRMHPKRIDFQKKVACAMVLQRLHRNRHFRVAVMRERLIERRAVRLRIHEIIAYVVDLDTIKHDLEEEHLQLNLEEKFFVKVDANSYKTTKQEFVQLPFDVHALTPQTIESKEKQTHNIRTMILTDMMVASNGSVDPAATLSDVDKGPFPPKTFFLTVTVNKADDMKQLYRVDLPMKEAHEFVFNETTAERIMVIDKVNSMFEGNPSLYQHVSKIKLYPPKPIITFPACPGGVHITMILSRVTEWPRAHYICENTYPAEHSLIWRQVTCVSHGMVSHDIPTLPTAMRRLQMYIKKNNNSKVTREVREKDRQNKNLSKVIKKFNYKSLGSFEYDSDGDSIISTSSVESLATVSSVSSSMTTFPSIDKKFIHSSNRRNKVVTSARVLWTLMPTPNAGVVVGFMNFFAHSNPTSSSIKYWCVVVDSCLFVYKNRGDTKPPRESVNLTVCHFLLTDKDMIRIYRPSDRQVWFCQGTSVHKRHDWVAWIQSACCPSRV